LKDPTIKRVLALFALVTVVLVAVAVHAVRQLNRTVTASDWVNRTHALINELEGIAAATQSAEGSLRVYALTRDPRDLAAGRRSQVRLADHLDVAGALARDQAPPPPRSPGSPPWPKPAAPLPANWGARRPNHSPPCSPPTPPAPRSRNSCGWSRGS
jgi:hypothetical protein